MNYMAKHLYLCRHGETEWNRERRIQGRTDIELSAEGEAQAAALGQFFVRERPKADIIVSSPMKRAQKTAQIVAETLGLPCVTDDDIIEVHTGVFTGKKLNDLADDPAWQAHLADPWHVGFGTGGESAEAVRERMMRAVTRYERAIFVTHATPIRHVILDAFDIDTKHLYDIHIANAAATYILFREHGPKLMYMNRV